MGPAIVGTLLITGAATVLAVPLGVLGGIYLNEYSARSALGRIVSFFAEVMTGVPSIVMGLFIYTIWVLRFGVLGLRRSARPRLSDAPRRHPHHRGDAQAGRIGSPPVRVRTRRAEGRHVLRVVLPAAAPGIVSGALLAVARAAGETAPLLFTILTVNETNTDLFNGPNTTLSAQIYRNAAAGVPWPTGTGMGCRAVAHRDRLRLHPPRSRALLPPSSPPGSLPRMSLVDDRSQPMEDVARPALTSRRWTRVPRSSGNPRVRSSSRSGTARSTTGAHLAVADVSFDVGAREITAIIGPSGLRQEHVPPLPEPDERLHHRRQRRW